MEILVVTILILIFLFSISADKKKEVGEEYQLPPEFWEEAKLMRKIIALLDEYDFMAADKLFFDNQNLSKDEYENYKKFCLKRYLDEQLEEKLGFSMDIEKALALSKTDQNLLLSASAGSGKTSTLVYKAYFLIHKQNILPREIMILAFNRKAAREIKNRIEHEFALKSLENIRTFHSFAYQIVKPKKRILLNQELYVKKIIRRIIGKNASPETIQVFTQFIQKAKKSRMSFEKIEEEIDNFEPQYFLKLANRIYKEYSESLRKDNFLDFDDLLTEAIEMIKKTKGECKARGTRLNDLKYLLIDEYQDFSKLFYDLIQAIRKYNPEIKLFCVGDSWQAINGFAGSDLKYFNNFIEYFDNSGMAYLLTNYRSRKEIIDCSNQFMLGESRNFNYQDNAGGEVVVRSVDGDNSTNGYLKSCAEIVESNPNKSVAILHRKNEINNITLESFYKRLIRISNTRNRIMISTVHKFKGQEADVVIILQATKKLFPLIHPYNNLFKIFGQSNQDILDEEKRLFYVALTRAKEKLFILTERGDGSEYEVSIWR